MNQNTFAVNANLLKRTGAAILDFLFFISSSLLLISYAFGPLYQRQFNTDALASELTAYQLASYLYVEDEETEQLRNLSVSEAPTGIYNYYALFKNDKAYPGNESFVFSISWYNTTILDTDATTSLFELVENNVDVLAVEKADSTTAALDTFYTAAYRTALLDFNTYPPFASLVTDINRYFLEVVAWSTGVAIVFYYLLMPLLFKDGQTLGKKTVGLAVVNQFGYRLKWWQTVVRFFVIVITFYTAPISVFGSVLISYTLMIFTKRNRSANDFLAMTRVIHHKQSLIFDDENAFLDYQKSLGEPRFDEGEKNQKD